MMAVALGVLMVSTTTFADASLNSPGSMPTMTVANNTTHPCSFGQINGCWQPSTTASPGDIIAAQIYFKNTSNETAHDVKVAIQPSRSGTHVTFNGVVVSSNAPRVSGTATVTLSQEETISTMPQNGPYQADWRTNTDTSPKPVNIDYALGGGFTIGDLAAGEEGVLTVRFQVNGTPNNGGGGGNTNACAINNFSANPTSINLGSTSALSWTTSNCQYVNITQVGTNLATDNSGYTVSPTNTTTYTLTAYPGGATAKATVTVTNNNNGGGGTNNYCTINSFYVDSNSIVQGQTTTLHWNTSGANYVYISGFGNEPSSGSVSISPYTSTSYTLTLNGSNCNGNGSQSVYVSVNQPYYGGGGTTINYQQPQAITTVASVLGSYSAQLNGIAVPNTSYGSASAWFEYGVTTSLGNRSDTQNVNGYGTYPYNANISGLAPGGTYYYRAVVQTQAGIAYGSVVPFSAPAAASTYVPPTKVVYVSSGRTTRTTTNVGAVANSQPSLFSLQVNSNADHMCVGGTITYTVNYQNVSAQDLQNVVLRITFPGEIDYVSSSGGDYDAVGRVVTISLGDVQPGQQGQATVTGQVNNSGAVGKLTVMTATINYTNPVTHAQEQAVAYSLITISNDCPSVLGASVFGFGGFLPTTLLGWLLLILIILALVVLARSLYRKNEHPA